jgi:tRNA modification GTPase
MDVSDGAEISALDQELINKIKDIATKQVPIKIVWNKLDRASSCHKNTQIEFYVSAKTGLGLEALKQELLNVAGWQPDAEGGILARQRHIEALLEAEQFINNALVLLKRETASVDLAAEEMRLAQDALSKITGQFLPDDLLGKIFSTFCIGK